MTDARLRLTVAIRDVPTRQKLILSLSDLEIALRQGDAKRARDYLVTVDGVLGGYRALSIISSAADVSAMDLALSAVTTIVGTPVL